MLWVPLSPESLSPVLKVPLLFSNVFLLQAATRPPQPPGKVKEGEKQDVLSAWARMYPKSWDTNHVLWWSNSFIESTIILASRHPKYLSWSLLSTLIREPRHNVADIRITPIWLTGWALMVSGSILRLVCHNALGRFYTWDLTVKENQTVVTTGPYAVVRHPGYVGSLMIGVGSILMHFGSGSWFRAYGGLNSVGGNLFAAAWGIWSLSIPLWLMKRTTDEDKVLRESLGAEWEAYSKKTPYKFIPYIY